MKIPFRQLLFHMLVYAGGFTALWWFFPSGQTEIPSKNDLLITFLVSLVTGGFFAYQAWRAEHYLERKNTRWKEKKQQER